MPDQRRPAGGDVADDPGPAHRSDWPRSILTRQSMAETIQSAHGSIRRAPPAASATNQLHETHDKTKGKD